MQKKQIILPSVIPSIQNNKDLNLFVRDYDDPWILLKVGDINTLPNIIRKYHAGGKKVIVHQDSISGLSLDRSGIHYLARIGADGVDTTKLRCIPAIRQENLLAVVGLFIIDSISIESSVKVIQEGQPDYAILMPSCLPKKIVESIQRQVDCRLLGGGLCNSREDLEALLGNGLSGAITSEKSLWHKTNK